MAFRFDKLTIKAQEAVQRAQELAADRGNSQIEPLHLLAGLLSETEGVIRPVLEKIGANRGQLDKIHCQGRAQAHLAAQARGRCLRSPRRRSCKSSRRLPSRPN